jgi:DNA-binding transcriptional MerR regulator
MTTQAPAWLTIGQVSESVGLTPDTLRWYERIGLVEPIPRDTAGQRRYRPLDVERVELLVKMRSTGMPLAQMHQYVELIHGGPATRGERIALLREHRERTLARIEALRRDLVVIDRKISRYLGLENDDVHHKTG